MLIQLRTSMYVRKYGCIYVRAYVCMYAYICVYIRAYACMLSVCIHADRAGLVHR
jgi:hypothetical protein